MAESLRYRSLKRRIAQLDRRLLPRLNATGAYSSAQYDRVRAYRVLVHAEIEACIEDLAFETLVRAYGRWVSDKRPRHCLVAVVAYHDSHAALPRSMPPIGGPSNELPQALERAKDWYCGYVRGQNHGIREKHVLSMLLPLGVHTSEIDNTWLATIDSYGQDRGETAHGSAMKPHAPPDPANERAVVTQIVAGLAPIDERLAVLRRQR
jgi:hypothetical protein